MFDLSSRTAFVTGAGQHVGRAIAEALAGQGAAVAVNDLIGARARDVAESIVKSGGRAIAVPGDVTDLEAVEAMVRETEAALGPVDILVSNAGNSGATRAIPTQFVDMDPSDWKKYVDINFYGVLNGIHAVLPGMCQRRFGRIITIASDAGRQGLAMGMSVYSGGKAAAMGFQRSLACEVGPAQVTVNTVSLGMIPGDWDMGPPKGTPLGRHGVPKDVGPAVVYFASDEASWVTGQILSVNGGVYRNV
ncbi:MAG: SDR family oxidoreductase [Deltaproteobacteria bacterium]|nr:SDR family oxidoreductase [Deltaproteobacteria bacterium]